MCSICQNLICPAQCPGYRERNDRYDGCDDFAPLAVCDGCGEELYAGDEAVIMEDYVFCVDCVSNLTVTLTPENAPIKD